MTNKNTGGPAFPVTPDNYDQSGYCGEGMTLRDYFAAKAMSGICAHPDSWGLTSSQAVAKQAYDIADAMMEARNE